MKRQRTIHLSRVAFLLRGLLKQLGGLDPNDIIFVLGVLLLAVGLGMVSIALAFIAIGALFVYLAVVGAGRVHKP